ncbi:dihydrolipoamide acetyltransferase family protein [Diaminobutyricibacter sp. McL0608]|uniref:dihydrolipoamide acetyltransferase family protein n=1 Tax=Leifsonia sp. McL0608 TaxID=3143537 RepID=UPI0031F2F8E5
MSVQVFRLPDLGEGLTEAALVRWLVSVGDEVVVDQPVAEVETAKSVVEVPSPFGGVISALHGDEGEDLRVGAPLIEVDAGGGSPSPESGQSGSQVASEPVAQRSGNVLVGYGTTETRHTGRRRRATLVGAPTRVAAQPAPAPAPAAVAAPTRTSHHPVISPVVRQLAKTRGLDLASLAGSGPGGLITRRDVENATPSAAPATLVGADSGADARTALGIRSTTPLGIFRRTVAANMARSRSEIPEATVWVDVDATDLWELRSRMRLGERHPSLLSFIARFTLSALATYPVLAGRLTADATAIEEFDGVNLGFAVDTPRGLVVPVVRHAETLTLRELNGEFDRLTGAAREGRAAPAELAGSTFTINNYGSLGVDGSAAIINHPEVAILGVGRFIERPWVVGGTIVPRRIVQLSLVFDHRVCDGGVAAGMLRAVADSIEHPFDLLADAPPA